MSVSSIGLSVLPLHHWLPWCVDSGDASKLDIPLFPSATHRHIRAREPKLARLSPHHYRSLPVTTGHYPKANSAQHRNSAVCPWATHRARIRVIIEATDLHHQYPQLHFFSHVPTVAVTTCHNMSQHTGMELLMPAWDWKSAALAESLF